MTRTTLLELHKEGFVFSAGHFVVFSRTERENLHGHNYHVDATLKVQLSDNGMAFDCRDFQTKIADLCQQLDLHFLLPGQSTYLRIEDKGDMWIAHHHTDKIPFLKKDVLVLPVTNITLEELSYWFMQQLTANANELAKLNIQGMRVRVYNGPLSADATWGNL